MRKFWATMSAVIMILCAMPCASACGGAKAPAPSDPDRTETDPSGNGNGNNDDEDNDDDPYAKYSNILKTVLTSSYYQDIRDHCKDFDSKDAYFEKLSPHPYKLLENLGINIDKIKNKETSAYSTAYIKGNDISKLYVTTRVENKDATPYYHCITACYELNEKEYADLEMLHRNQYVQAPLFIQELSYQKEPINYTYSKIAVRSYEGFQRLFKNTPNLSTNVFGTKNVTVDFIYFSLEENRFEVRVRTSEQKKGLIGEGQICVALLYPNVTDMTTLSYDKSVFTGPTQNFGGSLEDYQNSLENVTYFNADYEFRFLVYIWNG